MGFRGGEAGRYTCRDQLIERRIRPLLNTEPERVTISRYVEALKEEHRGTPSRALTPGSLLYAVNLYARKPIRYERVRDFGSRLEPLSHARWEFAPL